MPNLPISGLPSGSSLTGTDLLVAVQGATTVRIDAVSILNYVTSSIPTINTSSFATTGSNTFAGNQFINGYITASWYEGNGGRLLDLPANTNWNYNKEYTLRKTEQLTFSGDYILENTYLYIEGGTRNSVGNWEVRIGSHSGSIDKTSNNKYLITGPSGSGGFSDGNLLTRYFDVATTMSVAYVWNGTDIGDDFPVYDIQNSYPYEIDNSNKLQNTSVSSETGTWTLNIPSDSWLTFGVWSNSSNGTAGTLEITLPYLFGEDVEYSQNKYFKKQGTIFIGGNLLVKDSVIENNGEINVGGEVILIGDSQIIGTGTII